ncbi:MAG: Stealth CR1 domain-containing protein [Bacteroidales bacterium]|nr:Stealth CR1 domain-containing protein [Bacteroidales bacterium]
MEKIDFVLTWVDGSDPRWIAEKRIFQGNDEVTNVPDDSNIDCRYRPDTELLRYWFRAVEKFAPWVNKIHFVTCGQKPEWLNETHLKLHLVNHRDYIPSEYLPTFNSNVIELNYHRINDLSEHFVLFNDDMFLLQPVRSEFFFRYNNPVLATSLRYTNKVGYNNWSRVIFNDYCLVNRSFDMKTAIWRNKEKWFNMKALGRKQAIQNFVCFIANKTLPVGLYGHVALPHLKSTLQEIWEKYPEIMEHVSMHKFRSDDQVNQWLLCAWNQAQGRFYPALEKNLGQNHTVTPDNVDWICELIRKKQIPQICINDSQYNIDPEHCNEMIAKAFESILPEKSSFEK